MKTEQEEITTEEAAALLRCSPRTIRNMIDRGSIKARMDTIDPTVKKGVYKIPRSEMERILLMKSRPSPAQQNPP